MLGPVLEQKNMKKQLTFDILVFLETAYSTISVVPITAKHRK